MMIIRVLPIHVPPCYEGGYLKPLHWKHIWLMMIIWSDPSMFHDAVSPWSLHIYHYEAMQGQGPHFPPTRKATIHIHRGEGGKGVKMGTLHWGGVGGGLAKPGSYIYICIYILYFFACQLKEFVSISCGWQLLHFVLPADNCHVISSIVAGVCFPVPFFKHDFLISAHLFQAGKF